MSRQAYTRNVSEESFMFGVGAQAKAREIADSDILSNDLEKLAERLCTQPKLQIASLRRDEKRGKRNGNKITVTIPFNGDPESFELKPSRFKRPNTTVLVYEDHLAVIFPDDDHLEKNVDQFLDTAKENLDSVSREWSSMNANAKIDVRAILDDRKKKLEAARERDAKRSFPID